VRVPQGVIEVGDDLEGVDEPCIVGIPGGSVEVGLGDQATTIALAPPPPGKSAGNTETGISLQTDDIDAYHAELKANGVDVDPDVSRMGDPVPPLFWLRDPEGNTLMVVQ